MANSKEQAAKERYGDVDEIVKAHAQLVPKEERLKRERGFQPFIVVISLLGVSLLCFFYFLIRSNYEPIGDGSLTMLNSTLAENRINGMIGSGVAIAVCFATLFYLKLSSRSDEAGQ